MTLFQRISSTNAPASVILIRLIVGAVFLTEGIQKFLFPAEVGRDASPRSASPALK